MVSRPRSVPRFKSIRVAMALTAPILLSLLFAAGAGMAMAQRSVAAASPSSCPSPDQFVPIPLGSVGKVPVGTTASEGFTFAICDTDVTSDTICSVSIIAGADSGDFAITTDTCLNYDFTDPQQSCASPTQTCTVDFTFTPSQAGKRVVTIALNDSEATQWQEDLYGIGGIIVTPPQIPPNTPVPSSNIFPLMSPSTTAAGSASITFTAASAITGTVDWTTTTDYGTSGGYHVPASVATFSTTQPNQAVTETYTGVGGKMTIEATAQEYTDTSTAYITGTSIPESDITQVTTNMYNTSTGLDGGPPATPNLFTMIAYTESTCHNSFT